MKLPSFLDYVANPALAVIVIVLLFLQWRFPLRRQHFAVLRRLIRNYVVSVPGFVIVRLAMLPIPFAIAAWAQSQDVGLLNWLDSFTFRSSPKLTSRVARRSAS